MNPRQEILNEFNPMPEPQLSADFASRVMHEVGRVRARRRIRRQVIGALSGAAIVFGIYLMPTARLIGQHTAVSSQPVTQAASAATEWDDSSDANLAAYAYSTVDETQQASAVDYFFPDVKDLQDFSDEYATGSTSSTDYSTWTAGAI
jgi:hypothetical protein